MPVPCRPIDRSHDVPVAITTVHCLILTRKLSCDWSFCELQFSDILEMEG